MQRGEAIQVLREIIRVCGGNSVLISSVSLIAPSHDNGLVGYQLKIGTLNEVCRESLMPMLKNKGVEIEEKSNYITILKHH